MEIISEKNKSFVLQKEISSLKTKSIQKTILKTLLSTAALVGGIAMVIFLNLNFLPYGIGIILLSTVAIYEHFTHYRMSSKIFSKGIKAIEETYGEFKEAIR